jgi:hypothetical protein
VVFDLGDGALLVDRKPTAPAGVFDLDEQNEAVFNTDQIGESLSRFRFYLIDYYTLFLTVCQDFGL